METDREARDRRLFDVLHGALGDMAKDRAILEGRRCRMDDPGLRRQVSDLARRYAEERDRLFKASCQQSLEGARRMMLEREKGWTLTRGMYGEPTPTFLSRTRSILHRLRRFLGRVAGDRTRSSASPE